MARCPHHSRYCPKHPDEPMFLDGGPSQYWACGICMDEAPTVELKPMDWEGMRSAFAQAVIQTFELADHKN